MLMQNTNTNINLSTEFNLLLNCIHYQIGFGSKEKIILLVEENIDWMHLVQIASFHGVLLHLYQSLYSICPLAVPDKIFTELRHQSHVNAVRNAIAAKELLELLNFFKEHNIRTLPFKGLVLSQFIYGNIVLRQFCDLDILIEEHEFARAITLMESEFNYEIVGRGWKFLNPKHEQKYIFSEQEYSLSNGTVIIDLHKKLITPDYFLVNDFDFNKLWESGQVVSLSGHEILSLGTEDLLLYLCIHGSKECWRSLKWICDVAALIHGHPKLNWPYIKQQAERLGASRMLFIGLLLARDLINISLPEILTKDIQRDSDAQKIVSSLLLKLFQPNKDNKSAANLNKLFLYLKMMKAQKDKLNILRFWIKFMKIGWKPNTKDSEFIQLPSKLYFLYFLIHPFRLVYKRLKA